MADLPQDDDRGRSSVAAPVQGAETGTVRREPSIHLIRISERQARIDALRVLIALEEGFVRMDGNYFGLSSRQVAGLEAAGIPIERMRK